MTTIIRSATGETYGVEGSFEITPMVVFYRGYTLGELPSSEEGRSAFQIEERLYADIAVKLTIDRFNGSKQFSTLLYSVKKHPLDVPPVAVSYEQSTAFLSFKEENKEKFRIRLKKLQGAISQKEGLTSQPALTEGIEEGTLANVQTIDAQIASLIGKLQNLLDLKSDKPITEPANFNEALAQLTKVVTVSLDDQTTILGELMTKAYSGYEIL